MKIEFADSFGDSLKTLIRHETWWYKIYSTIRYDIPSFFKNIYRFRKVLWEHRWYDYRFTLQALQTSIQIMEKEMHRGNEVAESRDKKIAKMQRAIELIQHIMDDDYIDRVEEELGPLVMHDWEFEECEDRPGSSRLIDKETPAEKAHNKKIFNTARNLADKEWRELWNIFKGQSNLDWNKHKKTLKPDEISEAYNQWFNGSDMRGWWD
jgi:hypothetical protein